MPSKKGFTLIELMVVLAIVGILSLITYTRAKRINNVSGANSIEYLKYPLIVSQNLSLLKNWAPGREPMSNIPKGKESQVPREDFLKTIAQLSSSKMPNLLYRSGSGNAIVAGGLVVLSTTSSAAGILDNEGNWHNLPQERIESPNYYNTVGYAGIWRNGEKEHVLMILVDQIGDYKKEDVKEQFHFYVDATEWPSRLLRQKEFNHIDTLKGEVTAPQNQVLKFSGKIARYFPDSVNMPPHTLVSSLEGLSIFPLFATY